MEKQRSNSNGNNLWGKIWGASTDVFSSGAFFMLVGILFLIAAYYSLSRTHSALIFVLVVLGVAIVLFGTGTQSVSTFGFKDSSSEIRFKGYLAGGAGTLALIVGAGIVGFHKPIKEAFREQKRFAKVYFQANGRGEISLKDCLVEFHQGGETIPVRKVGKYFVALVSYDPTDLNTDRESLNVNLEFELYSKNTNKPCIPADNSTIPVDMKKTIDDTGGFDIRRVKKTYEIALQVEGGKLEVVPDNEDNQDDDAESFEFKWQ